MNIVLGILCLLAVLIGHIVAYSCFGIKYNIRHFLMWAVSILLIGYIFMEVLKTPFQTTEIALLVYTGIIFLIFIISWFW